MTDENYQEIETDEDMTINDGDDDFYDENAPYNVVAFLADLENFLVDKLDDNITRGNVFLSENKNGVTVNLIIGTPFAASDLEVNQVNVIIVPTDRKFLGSEGVHMSAEDFKSDDDGNVFFNTREQAREYARDNSNSKFEDKGQDAADGKRWSCHEAFDNAMSHLLD